MAYHTHHCSTAFRCSVYLIAFRHTSLALSVLPLFMLYAPCPFTAQFLFCAIQLLHSPPPSPTTTTANSNSNSNPISSLYHVFIASVHLVHAMFIMPLHADFAPLSSTSRVLCLIIIVTFQLLWWFAPLVQNHCMLYWDSSASLAVWDSSSSLWQSNSPSLFQLQASMFISCQSPPRTSSFLSETLHLLCHSSRSVFASSGRNHQWFLAVSLCRATIALRSPSG